MPKAIQITQRMSEKRSNTDLGLVYDMWSVDICDENPMRASGQNAIRKAVAAIDRVANEMTRRLTSGEDTAYRVLPEINPATRVRKTPERFWLEFNTNLSDGNETSRTAVFFEFSATQVNFGIRLPTTSTAIEADKLSGLDQLKSLDEEDLAAWHIEQRRPPAEGAACSRDLNTWLTGRVVAKQKNDLFLTLSKTYSNSRPLMVDIVAGLDEASQLCALIHEQSMGWKQSANPIIALRHASII